MTAGKHKNIVYSSSEKREGLLNDESGDDETDELTSDGVEIVRIVRCR